MASVRRIGGMITVRLNGDEAAVLSQLPALVDGAGGDEDPGTRRLRPNAYEADDEAAWEFTRLTASELDGARRRDAESFAASIEHASSPGLTPEQAESWVRLVGDARLLLAAREGVEREGELPSPSTANPRLTLVHYLGGLQHELVEALLVEMADT